MARATLRGRDTGHHREAGNGTAQPGMASRLLTPTPDPGVGDHGPLAQSSHPGAAVIDTGAMNKTQAGADLAEMATALTLGSHRLAILDRARIYACGITPYDVTHLGHAATFVWVDTLARTLRLLRVEPEICRNITDVDNILDEAAHRAEEPYDSFAAVQQYYFDRDMAALNVHVGPA